MSSERVALLDVNVLIALAWPNHVHHEAAHRWFAEDSKQGWATCPLTQSAFVRISSNPRIIPDAVSVVESLAILRRIVDHPQHDFWADSLDLSLAADPPIALVAGHRQVTDLYLLLMAEARDGVLVTFDAAIRNGLSATAGQRQHILVITP